MRHNTGNQVGAYRGDGGRRYKASVTTLSPEAVTAMTKAFNSLFDYIDSFGRDWYENTDGVIHSNLNLWLEDYFEAARIDTDLKKNADLFAGGLSALSDNLVAAVATVAMQWDTIRKSASKVADEIRDVAGKSVNTEGIDAWFSAGVEQDDEDFPTWTRVSWFDKEFLTYYDQVATFLDGYTGGIVRSNLMGDMLTVQKLLPKGTSVDAEIADYADEVLKLTRALEEAQTLSLQMVGELQAVVDYMDDWNG